MSELRDHIAGVRAGQGDAKAMLAAFRDTVLLVPHSADGAVVAGAFGGLQWLYAFTTAAELAAWVVASGGDATAEQPYLSVLGSRLLDMAVPSVGRPAGVAIDVAGEQPMLLPPVHGIVPDAVAVA